MAGKIEDYALIGDCQSAALVCRDGSIDWLCLPRFDSAACFAALLGTPENGRWRIAPAGSIRRTERKYREGTLVLETVFETAEGTVALVDFMPPRSGVPDLVRVVEGRSGTVPMRMDLVLRFDYGAVMPWVRKAEGGITAIAGPDMVRLYADVPVHGENFHTVADFTVSAGQKVAFDLTYHPSHDPGHQRLDVHRAAEETEQWWRSWSDRCKFEGEWCEAVKRSLITLKAMTYAPTGGIVAAPTTSLPEHVGGVRNWDYRYCWLRDATLTLFSLLDAGYLDEARAWREWLLRAVAGDPSKTQIMYGIAGERRLSEWEVPWLAGYEGSKPVRVGNGAWDQFQLDVYGEVLDALHQCRKAGLESSQDSWQLQAALLDFLEGAWERPDEGIWEVRGPQRHFTHSKVMAWVAFDRAVRTVRRFGYDGPVDRWRSIRDAIHDQVCRAGWDDRKKSFTQSYGSDELDASLLMIPLVGFLPPSDPRVRGTVEAIERELTEDGFVARYIPVPDVDGLPPGEGTFLPCSFWMVDCLAMIGRHDDARALFDRLLSIRNDVGLLAEEYDPHLKRQVGNFPQAFTHIGLVNSAFNLARNTKGPNQLRPDS